MRITSTSLAQSVIRQRISYPELNVVSDTVVDDPTPGSQSEYYEGLFTQNESSPSRIVAIVSSSIDSTIHIDGGEQSVAFDGTTVTGTTGGNVTITATKGKASDRVTTYVGAGPVSSSWSQIEGFTGSALTRSQPLINKLSATNAEVDQFLVYGGINRVTFANGLPPAPPIQYTKHTSDIFTKNQNFALADVDLSFIGVGLDTGSGYYTNSPPLLITPQHVAGCRHYRAMPAGSKVKFIGSDGNIYEGTVAHEWVQDIGESNPGDYRIAVLESPMPSEVAPAIGVAQSWLNVGTIQDESPPLAFRKCFDRMLVFSIQQEKKLALHYMSGYIRDMIDVRTLQYRSSQVIAGSVFDDVLFSFLINDPVIQFTNTIENGFYVNTPKGFVGESSYSHLTTMLRSGDSGSPTCILGSDNNAYLLCSLSSTFGGSFFGQKDGDVINAIIAQCNAQAGLSLPYTYNVTTDPFA